MTKERIERLILRRDLGGQKNKRKTPDEQEKKNELDSYNAFVYKISAGIMGPMGSALGKKLSKAELAEIEGLRPSKEATQRIMRRAGASPGKIKAVTGEAMADGGVVDLTTEMVIDE